MYPIDTSDKCTIYNSSFINDLEDHTADDIISDSRSGSSDKVECRLTYNTKSPSNITIKNTELKAILNLHTIPNTGNNWMPAIISHDNYIENKEILFDCVINNKQLGIEKCISIASPKFKNWTLTGGSDPSPGELSIDWVINSNLTYMDIEYGVMFWYKKNPTEYSYMTTYPIKDLPSFTVINATADILIKKIDPVTKQETQVLAASKSDLLIKIDNNTLKILNKDHATWQSDGTVNFHQGDDVIDLNTAVQPENIRFYSYYNKNFIGKDSDLIMPDYQMWISNGEFFSYFYNGKDKHDLKTHRSTKLPSRSYLSPCLYHIYRAIYNILTINRVRNSNNIGTVCYTEKLKKLCYILATSPLIDRVTINTLYNTSILTEIETYLNASSPAAITEEITELLTIVNKITKLLEPLTTKIDNQNNSINYIRTNSQLYNKLKSKYGASLYLDSNTNIDINFNSKLAAGPQGYFDINHKTFCSKNTTSSTIYNKFKYSIGDIIITNTIDKNNVGAESYNLIKQQMVTVSSSIDPTKKAEIPWDVTTEPILEKFRINIGKDIVQPMDPTGETQIDYKWNNDDTNDLSCSWRLIDGPQCLKFSNYAKNGRIDLIKRNNISNDINPSFYIKNDGMYTVECQITKSSVMRATDTMRLYIGNCDQTVAPRTTEYTYSDPILSYKVLCNNIRKFALHKQGILWIVDSDIWTVSERILTTFANPSRLIDTKIPIGFESSIGTNAAFKINFETLSTKVKIDSVTIEFMRDGDSNRSQCKSFYQEKIKRQRERVFGPYINGARYYRSGLALDGTIVAGKGVDETGALFDIQREFTYPPASTLLSPDIYSYGGYSSDVINTLGVEIPYHPVYDNASSRTISVKKLTSGQWGNGNDPNNKIIAKKIARLPRVDKRNYMEGSNAKIRCSLMDIPISGYATLSKGYFHPNSGWYPYDKSDFTDLIPNNIGSAAYASLNASLGTNITSVKRYYQSEYDSLYLRGYGIFDMRGSTSGIQTSSNTYQSRILLKSTEDINAGPSINHIISHGYRNLNGPSYKSQENIDDFYIDEILDRELEEDFICQPMIDDSLYNGIPTSVYAFDKESATYNLDSLTLQDLELKLNFLNYPNPRNIIISLEIYNASLSSDPDFNKIFISNSKTIPSIPDLQNYINKINTENTSSSSNSRIIYLLHQDAIDNYAINFNLLFSDNYSRFAIANDHNKCHKPTSYHADVIYSDNILTPTLSTNTYSDQNSTTYKKVIQNNFLPVTSAALSKFKNIPLKNTSFVLKVTILGPEDRMISMDNVVNNSELLGLSSYEIKKSSNTIANSLCSWDLIIHTKPKKKFHNKNHRGHFDYDNNSESVIKGYNFIADFTDKEYLIPKANINAPYDYLANINYYCRYINDDDLSKPLTYRQFFFPFVFYSFTPFFTIVGALAAVWELTAQMSLGGRGDPIISFLYDLKFQRMQEELERNYFQPGYEAVAQGYPDKALVLLSQDKINWYKVEVPIYKYENSDILKLKQYKYVKLVPEAAKQLSTFKFETITNLDDLISPDSIKYTFTTSVMTTGLTQYDQIEGQQVTLNFSEGDLVNLQGQTPATNNGIYVVKTSSWVRFPDFNNLAFLVNNKYYNSLTNLTQANISGKKVIAIKGSRAAHFFDINDSVFMSQNADLTGAISKSLNDIYLINLGTSVYTILVFNSALDTMSSGYAYKPNNNMILIYSDNETLNDDSQIGKWGLEKTTNELDTLKIPKLFHSALGEGNYGYGTPYLDPDTYSTIQLTDNRIEQIYEIFNNHINDKFKYNTVFLTDGNGASSSITFDPATDPPDSLLQAYPFAINNYDYAYNTAGYSLNVPTGMPIQDKENLLLSIGNNVLQKDNQAFYFMDLKSDKFNSISNSGTVSFENDYVRHVPVQKLSTTQLSTIENRLNFISTTGISASTLMSKSLTDIGNIPDLLTYYNNLSEDPVECYSTTPGTTICKKRKAKQKLNDLYAERIQLLDILDNNAASTYQEVSAPRVVDATCPKSELVTKVVIGQWLKGVGDIVMAGESLVNIIGVDCNTGAAGTNTVSVTCPMTGKLQKIFKQQGEFVDIGELIGYIEGGDVLPMVAIDFNTVSKGAGEPDGAKVEYKTKNYYWFNIDAKQTCSLSDEACPRILYQTKYACSPIVEYYQYPECDSVCGSTITIDGDDVKIENQGLGVSYTSKTVEQEKQKYPHISNWDTDLNTGHYPVVKKFFMSCENSSKDTLVTVTETYLYPKTNAKLIGTIDQVFSLNAINNIYLKFRIIPRKLKTIDSIYQRYLYDYYGNLGRDLIPAPGGTFFNGLFAWRCFDIDSDSNNFGKTIETPPFFKLMNEMIFRAYFGSIDGVEHKNSQISDPKEFWEWIPYEYFIGPVIE